MAIKCGNCHEYHPNVQAVRGCHLASGKIKPAEERVAIPVVPVPNSQPARVRARWLDGDPSADVFEGTMTPPPAEETKVVQEVHISELMEQAKQTYIASKQEEVDEVMDLLEPVGWEQEDDTATRRAHSFLNVVSESESARKYLNIPYAEKDRAKELFGAKWDSDIRQWWVPEKTFQRSKNLMPGHWLESLVPTATSGGSYPDLTLIDEDGFYQSRGEYYKVQQSQTNGRLYAKKLVKQYPEYLEKQDSPKEAIRSWSQENGKPVKWEYKPGLLQTIANQGAKKMEPGEAIGFGQLYGVCMICGAILNNEDSIDRGIGPICAEKIGYRG